MNSVRAAQARSIVTLAMVEDTIREMDRVGTTVSARRALARAALKLSLLTPDARLRWMTYLVRL